MLFPKISFLTQVYDRMWQKPQLFLMVLAVSVLTGCGGGASMPYYSPWAMTTPTETKTITAEDLPDIAWQTHKQRNTLSRQPIQVDPEATQRALEAAAAAGRPQDPNRPSLEKIFDSAIPSQQQTAMADGRIKVALLLPLSGQHSQLGQAMLKASQLALFDVGSENFELMPRDTGDTPDQAARAAQSAIENGADLILGPIFAEHLKTVKPVAVARNIPVISYSTDWTLSGNNTYIMGFMPFTQVARVAGYAHSQGYTRFAVYGPQTEYNDVVTRTLQHATGRLGGRVVAVSRFSPQQPDIGDLVKDFVATHKTGENSYTFDALMLPMGGETLRLVANMFDYEGLTPEQVRFIGTGLWDDPSLAKTTPLYGGWFAAPDPSLRRDFERRYKSNYGEEAMRLSTLAYDSTALAAVLARVSPQDPYNRANMTNPRGFAGIDGIFRFRPDGLVERGLAILELKDGKIRVVDPAPTAFSSGS